ncbi:MAG: T9SS type A sorting domain-containing protein [Chitinophagaceae bacterium]|nr:T9SS type A sorting domain-containing protein [Chitinophagaceae bacterium]
MRDQILPARLLFLSGLVYIFLGLPGCKPVNNVDSNEGKDMYSGPEMRARLEYDRTKDPATGRVPSERLMIAMEQTRLSKIAFQNSSHLISALNWEERGPNSDVPGPSNGNTRANSGIAAGRVRAIMVDSTDATRKTVWVGGVDGGLWKTTDITVSPANWILVNDFLSNLAVADICQDPRPGFQNIMYFCTGESYYNFDAVRGNGVFKSTDGGITWNHLASTAGYLNSTRIRCDYQGNIYLATRGTGLLRSTAASGGAAWTNITPAGLPADICDLEISSTSAAGRLHVVTGIFSTQGYRYTDIPATVTSASWTAPAIAFPSYAMRAEIACMGSTLYALPANGSYQVPTIYKSTDGGANWASTAGQPTVGWGAGQAWYNLTVAIDPSDPNNCIVGALDTWKTTNGGTSWSQISNWVGTTPVNQYVHADVHNITWYDGGNKLIFGCDGGIHYSSDKGSTIRDRNIGLRIKQFYSCAIHPSTTNYFLAGAQDNGVHQFSNAGLSNTIEVTGGDGGFVAIDQDQPQYQFGSYVFNQYRRSNDGGASWTQVNLSGTGQFINPFDYDNTANIMYCGDAAGAYRRWTNPQTGSASAVVNITGLGGGSVLSVSVSPYTANRVYFGTDNGRVVQVDGANTIASGSAGTNLSTGLPAGSVSCINQGTNDQNLIAVYSNYGINNVWISTNGGTSWTASDGNLPDMPVRWAMFYPGDDTKAYIATETGVWETSLLNGASTVWESNNTFPSVRTDMIEYRASDRTLAAATHGRGLWTAVIPLVTTPDIQFQFATGSSTEATAFTSGCRGYTDYTANMNILNPPTGTATVTLSVTGGTALQQVDYAITTNGNFATPSMDLTFANGITTPQAFTIRVYDDAAVETAETFILGYSISGATNAQAGSSNQTFTYTINDNDAAPLVSANLSGGVGVYSTNLHQPFRSSQFDARTQVLYTAAELTALGFTSGNITSLGFNVVTKGSTQPFNGFTIRLKNTATATLVTGAFETGSTTVYSANYSTVTGMNTIPITPFLWDGTSNLLVDMCFDNTTASGDDLIQGAASTANTHFDRQSTNATPGCSIANSVFVYGPTSARPIITFGITTAGSPVSTALNSTKNIYLGPFDDVYVYDGTGNIMARIKNLTAHDYGCTEVTIDRAGSTSAQFWNLTTSQYLTSKSFKVIPTNNTAAGNYEITFYYTAAEVNGWVAATGLSFAGTNVVKVSNGFYVPDITPATPHTLSVSFVPGVSAAFGANSTITGAFTATGFSGFAVGTPGVALPVTLLSFTGYQKDKYGVLEWKTGSEYNSKGFELEKSYDGSNFTKIAYVAGAGNTALPQQYKYQDKIKLTNIQYYRLKQVDQDQRFVYSNTVVLRSNESGELQLLSVTNPFFSSVNMMFSKPPVGIMQIRIIDMNGRQLYSTTRMPGNTSIVEFGIPAVLSSGSYVLQVEAGGQQFSKIIVKK